MVLFVLFQACRGLGADRTHAGVRLLQARLMR
jgi:hypothetical protein